jgi:hypothetical protein
MPRLGQDEPGLAAMDGEASAEIRAVPVADLRVQRDEILAVLRGLAAVEQPERDSRRRIEVSNDASTLGEEAGEGHRCITEALLGAAVIHRCPSRRRRGAGAEGRAGSENEGD